MTKHRTAVILGGGGVTGIGWQLGLLAGLNALGVDLNQADVLIGTSAGAFAAVELSCGLPIFERYQRQLEAPADEIAATMPPEVRADWAAAIRDGYPDPAAMARGLGRLALSHQAISLEARLGVVRARLPLTDWPERPLFMTAIDAETGELVLLSRDSGLTLTEAAAASGAVPGVWPPVPAGGRIWIDGGSLSSNNADLAARFERVVVIAPASQPSLVKPDRLMVLEELERAQEQAQVTLIMPDGPSREAIGPNALDPLRRPAAARAGFEQAEHEIERVRELWDAADGRR
jgi:NTE family protein